MNDPAQGDYERWTYRFFVNPAKDLLKYVYFFAAGKRMLKLIADDLPEVPQVRYAICYRKQDRRILSMYLDALQLEGLRFYEYQHQEDRGTD